VDRGKAQRCGAAGPAEFVQVKLNATRSIKSRVSTSASALALADHSSLMRSQRAYVFLFMEFLPFRKPSLL
jgi:hypothetical protein